MDPIQKMLVMALMLGMVFGFAARQNTFCTLGGLREALFEKNPVRLGAVLLAAFSAMVFIQLFELLHWMDVSAAKPDYRSASLPLGRLLIGGFVFGVGMVLAGGCSMRAIVHSGGGNLKALLLVLIMALSVYAMTTLGGYAEFAMPWLKPMDVNLNSIGLTHQDLGSVLASVSGLSLPWARPLAAVLIVLPGVWWLYKRGGFGDVSNWVSAVVIGLVVALGYWLTAGSLGAAALETADFMDEPPRGLGAQSFSFAGPLGATMDFIVNGASTVYLNFAVAITVGALLGSLLNALLRRQFKLQFSNPGWAALAKQVLGAVLVGIGAIMAMGCTIGHGLAGLGLLSLGSMLSMLAIVAGTVVAIKIFQR